MANVTVYWKDGSSNSVPDFDLSYWQSQGWSTTKPSSNTPPSTNNQNNNNQPSNNHTAKFSAYGYTIYNDATVSVITAPDGSGRQAVKWTNPDGSYVWETVDGSNVQNYAPQYYQGQVNPSTYDYYPEGIANKARVDSGELSSISTNYNASNKQKFIDAGFKIVGDQAVYTKSNATNSNSSGTYVYGADKLNSKANNAAVNTLYQAYFNRDATQAELNNWGQNGGVDTTVKALEDFLKSERNKYNVTTPIKTLEEITNQSSTNQTDNNVSSTSDDKIIYKKGTDLYIKNGNIFYKIPDQKTLEDLVFNKGYKDTRPAVPTDAEIGSVSATSSVPGATDTTDKKIYKKGNDLYTKQGDKYYKIPNTDILYDLVANKGYQDTRTEVPSDAIIGSNNGQVPAVAEDKNIYKKGTDLFIKRGDTFYKIPDVATLKDYVFNKGYIDSRLDLPTNAPTTTIGNEVAPTVAVPDDLANDPYFMQLDENNKAIVSYYYNTLASQNSEKAKAFQTALDLASKQADPYWKEKINIVKDELSRTAGTLDADLASREKTLMDRQNAINEDLISNKAYLTAEQQAELARARDSYDNELVNVRDQMAATGLSSSSVRNRAENKLATSLSDVIGSSTRAYEKNIADATKSATRELATIAQQTADYQRQARESKTSAVRTAEANLGSGNLADTSFAPLLMGNISGTLLENKGTDILNRAKALMNNNV